MIRKVRGFALMFVAAFALSACAEDNLVLPDIPDDVTTTAVQPAPIYQPVPPGQQALVLDQRYKDPAGRTIFRPIGDLAKEGYAPAQLQFFQANTGEACAQMAELEGLQSQSDQIQASQARLNALFQRVQGAINDKQRQTAEAQYRQYAYEAVDLIATAAQFYFAGKIKAPGDYKGSLFANAVSSLVRGLSYYDIATINLAYTKLYGQIMGLYLQEIRQYGLMVAVWTGETKIWTASMVDGCAQAGYLRPTSALAPPPTFPQAQFQAPPGAPVVRAPVQTNPLPLVPPGAPGAPPPYVVAPPPPGPQGYPQGTAYIM